MPDPSNKFQFGTLPCDLQWAIFSLLVSIGPVLTPKDIYGVASVLHMHQVPVVQEFFKHVTAIDFRSPDDGDSYAAPPTPLVQKNLAFLLRAAQKLQSVRLPNVLGSSFINYLPATVKELEFYDCSRVDLSTVVSKLKAVAIHNPAPLTIQKLMQRGDNIENISFLSVETSVCPNIAALFQQRYRQYSHVRVCIKSNFETVNEALNLHSIVRSLLCFFTDESTGDQLKLQELEIGPVFLPQENPTNLDDLTFEVPSSLRERIKYRINFVCGHLRVCAGSPLSKRMEFNFGDIESLENDFPGRAAMIEDLVMCEYETSVRIMFTPDEELEYLDLLTDCGDPVFCGDVLWKICLGSSLAKFKSLKQLLIRFPIPHDFQKQAIFVLVLLGMLQHTNNAIVLEVTRDFALLPTTLGLEPKLDWRKALFRVKALVLTSKVRISHLEVDYDVDQRNLTYSDIDFIAAIPNFLKFLRIASTELEVVHLEFRGNAVHDSQLSKRQLKDEIAIALGEVKKFQEDMPCVDCSSLRSQLEVWSMNSTSQTLIAAGR